MPKKKKETKAVMPAKAAKPPKAPPKKSGKLAERAFGEATDNFGKEIAPLGAELGVLAAKVGGYLIDGLHHTVYGVERIGSFLRAEVAKRLEHISDEKTVPPNPRIAIPAMQALVYSIGEEHIRDMFASLLAADMNADTKSRVHPAFVNLIKEMTPSMQNACKS